MLFVGDFEVCGFSIVSQLGVLFLGHVAHNDRLILILPDGANSHCTYFAQIVVGQLPSGLVGPARMDFPRWGILKYVAFLSSRSSVFFSSVMSHITTG
jgi:hypothetical protein